MKYLRKAPHGPASPTSSPGSLSGQYVRGICVANTGGVEEELYENTRLGLHTHSYQNVSIKQRSKQVKGLIY